MDSETRNRLIRVERLVDAIGHALIQHMNAIHGDPRVKGGGYVAEELRVAHHLLRVALDAK